MSFLERNQGLLDKERQLVEKEELLAHRQHQLSDYEKEVSYRPSHVPVQTNFRLYFCNILLNQAQTRLDHLKFLDQLWGKISYKFNNR